MVTIADSRLIINFISHLLTRASWLLMPSLSFSILEGKFSVLSRSPTMSIASCLAGSDVMSLSTPLLFIICNSLRNFIDGWKRGKAHLQVIVSFTIMRNIPETSSQTSTGLLPDWRSEFSGQHQQL
jgi:hypothetical protein